MTNKRRDDAAVAEIVGYTLWKWMHMHKVQSVIPPGINPDVAFPLTGYEQIGWNKYSEMICTNKVKPFTTAPTFASDGIVLEWVQGQIFSVRLEYFKKLNEIIQEPTDGFSIKWPDVLVHYKPGMYAKTLLETQEQRDE